MIFHPEILLMFTSCLQMQASLIAVDSPASYALAFTYFRVRLNQLPRAVVAALIKESAIVSIAVIETFRGPSDLHLAEILFEWFQNALNTSLYLIISWSLGILWLRHESAPDWGFKSQYFIDST